MPTQQEIQAALMAAALTAVPVAPPPTTTKYTSMRSLGVHWAEQVTDDVVEQSATVTAQTCPRNDEGRMLTRPTDGVTPVDYLIDGPEGYRLAEAIKNLIVPDSEFWQSVLALTGQDVRGLTFQEAAPAVLVWAELHEAARLAEAQPEN